jgi:hypothetical protein
MPTFSPLLENLTEFFKRVISNKSTVPIGVQGAFDDAIVRYKDLQDQINHIGGPTPTENIETAWKRFLPSGPLPKDVSLDPSATHRRQMEGELRRPTTLRDPVSNVLAHWFNMQPLGNVLTQGAMLGADPSVKTLENIGRFYAEGPLAAPKATPSSLRRELQSGLAARLKQKGQGEVPAAKPLEFATPVSDPSSWKAWETLTPEEASRLWQEHNGKMLIESADPSKYLQSLNLPSHAVDRIKDQALAIAAKENVPVEQFGGFTHTTAKRLAGDWYRSPEGRGHTVNLDVPIEDGVYREVATGVENAPKGAVGESMIPAAPGVNALVDWIDPRQIGVDKKLTDAVNHIPYSNRLILEGAMQGKSVHELRTLTHGPTRHYTPVEIRQILDNSKVMIDYELKTGRSYAGDLEEMLGGIENKHGEKSAGKAKEVLKMKLLNNWTLRTIAGKMDLSPAQVKKLSDWGIQRLRENGGMEKYRELFLK